MTTFVDHQHPCATDGKFTTKDHPEADLELGAPAVSLCEATGTWGPLFHDTDSRPSFDYTPSEAAATAFRAQFGAAPDTTGLFHYVFQSVVLGHATSDSPVSGHDVDLTRFGFSRLDMDEAAIGTHTNERRQSAEEPVADGFGARIYELTTTRFFSALAGAR